MPTNDNNCEHPSLEEMWIEVSANDESATIKFVDYCQVCGEAVGNPYTRHYIYTGEE